MPEIISLDEIMSSRQFSVKSTKGGEALTKIYKAPPSFDQEKRSARFIMTAEVADRYGDVVVAKGAQTAEFEKNPVALWAHNNRDFSIGLWSDLKTVTGTPKRVEGTCTLSPEGTTETSDTVYRLIAAGQVRACSIGFMPKAWERITDDKDRWIGFKFLEWELLECSICNVPANPAALAKAAGGDDHLHLQAIELVLDEWARTPEGLIVPRADYERAYQVTKGKEVTLHEVRAIEEEGDVDEITIDPATEKALEAMFEKKAEGLLGRWMKTFEGFFQAKHGIADPVQEPEKVDPPAPEPEEEKTKQAPPEAPKKADAAVVRQVNEEAEALLAELGL